jgi:hypothetical protein
MKMIAYRIYFTEKDFVDNSPHYVTIPVDTTDDKEIDIATGMQRLTAMYGITYKMEVDE